MKKALLVGINYVGTGNDLRGCLNDVYNMRDLIKDDFDEVELLLEVDATTQNILSGMRWLVEGAVPGDVLYFHYSGHGSQIRSTIEPDGTDEIICPIDLNWKDKVIRDDDMKEIFGQVPNGVNLTVFLDCCHSGSGLDQADTLYTPKVTVAASGEPGRFLPMPADIEQEIVENGLEVRAFKTSRDINRSAVLIAGCASHQTSADAFIEGQYQGAATYALRRALEDGNVSYRDIVDDMTEFMVTNRFTQLPQLDGHPTLYDQAFLEPWGTVEGTVEETPLPGVWQPPADGEAVKPKRGDNIAIIALICVIVSSLVLLSIM